MDTGGQSNLTLWGWDAAWSDVGENLLAPGQVPARVTAVYRERFLLRMPDGERTGAVTGRFRHEAKTPAEFPAIGDWVVAEAAGPELALIHGILPRRTVLSRKAAGEAMQEQVLAANVDTFFVMTAFDDDFSVRRIERYVAMARMAGMAPVVLLNKGDLAGADDPRLAEARAVTPEGAVLCLSAKTGDGLDSVRTYLREGKTGVFLGSSGVGKSTLLNALLGGEVQKTQTVRLSDGQGRHTTTVSQMFFLPGGGLVIDTPGLREIQLWADESVLSEVFAEVSLLAQSCRYADCAHKAEPGCAVKAAIETGALPPDRYVGYLKLQKELAYLKRKQDPVQAANTKRRWKAIHSSMREHVKNKRRIE